MSMMSCGDNPLLQVTRIVLSYKMAHIFAPGNLHSTVYKNLLKILWSTQHSQTLLLIIILLQQNWKYSRSSDKVESSVGTNGL